MVLVQQKISNGFGAKQEKNLKKAHSVLALLNKLNNSVNVDPFKETMIIIHTNNF